MMVFLLTSHIFASQMVDISILFLTYNRGKIFQVAKVDSAGGNWCFELCFGIYFCA